LEVRVLPGSPLQSVQPVCVSAHLALSPPLSGFWDAAETVAGGSLFQTFPSGCARHQVLTPASSSGIAKQGTVPVSVGGPELCGPVMGTTPASNTSISGADDRGGGAPLNLA